MTTTTMVTWKQLSGATDERAVIEVITDGVSQIFVVVSDTVTAIIEVVARLIEAVERAGIPALPAGPAVPDTAAVRHWRGVVDEVAPRLSGYAQSVFGRMCLELGRIADVPMTWVDEDTGELCLGWRRGSKYVELQLGAGDAGGMTWIYRDSVANERSMNLEEHHELDAAFLDLLRTIA